MNPSLIRVARLVAESFEELDRDAAQIATPLLKQLVEAAEERNEAIDLLRDKPESHNPSCDACLGTYLCHNNDCWEGNVEDFLARIDKEESE